MQFGQIEEKASVRADDQPAECKLAEYSPLASILAEMLRSALAWEAERGEPPHNSESDLEKGLTSNPQAYRLVPGTNRGERNDDYDDAEEKRQ